MQVINNEAHAVMATFDRKIEILIPPGCTADMPAAKRADVRPIETETGELRYSGPPSHESLYQRMRGEALGYRADNDDPGDAR